MMKIRRRQNQRNPGASIIVENKALFGFVWQIRVGQSDEILAWEQ